MAKLNQGLIDRSAQDQYPSQLRSIEAHVRRRLRSRIVAQQKKKRNLFARLLERGVRRGKAIKTAFSNKGRWALSHTKAVEQAYPNRWFVEELNLIMASDEKQPHWFALHR